MFATAHKQPANRESTKVLERFFKLHDEKQPDDEVAAWKRLAEILGEPVKVEVKPAEEVKVEEKLEEKPAEVQAVTPPIIPEPTPEAPAPARKASVQFTLSARSQRLLYWSLKGCCGTTSRSKSPSWCCPQSGPRRSTIAG